MLFQECWCLGSSLDYRNDYLSFRKRIFQFLLDGSANLTSDNGEHTIRLIDSTLYLVRYRLASRSISLRHKNCNAVRCGESLQPPSRHLFSWINSVTKKNFECHLVNILIP